MVYTVDDMGFYVKKWVLNISVLMVMRGLEIYMGCII